MEKQRESCPHCKKEVWVEPSQRCAYRCPSCNLTFTYTPDASSIASQPSSPASGIAAPAPRDFVETPFIRDLAERASAYLRDGLPVHFTGPAGGGKASLALDVARRPGRPIVLIHGDDQMGTADLVGKESGYKRIYSRDQFIHTVVKVEEESKLLWVGRALTEACEKGYTVVCDEFTRSRPEANNVLLSVLEERVLPLRGGITSVHSDFRIIFTSNPAEYAGVHGAQDALLDRMVTIHLEGFDPESEVAIAHARSRLPLPEVERIVGLVRAFRQEWPGSSIPSVRASILIARILKVRSGKAYAGDPIFAQACHDVLLSEARRATRGHPDIPNLEESLKRLIAEHCGTPLLQGPAVPERPGPAAPADSVLRELLQDSEIEALLLRKIQERGLADRLLTDKGKAAEG